MDQKVTSTKKLLNLMLDHICNSFMCQNYVISSVALCKNKELQQKLYQAHQFVQYWPNKCCPCAQGRGGSGQQTLGPGGWVWARVKWNLFDWFRRCGVLQILTWGGDNIRNNKNTVSVWTMFHSSVKTCIRNKNDQNVSAF